MCAETFVYLKTMLLPSCYVTLVVIYLDVFLIFHVCVKCQKPREVSLALKPNAIYIEIYIESNGGSANKGLEFIYLSI